MEKKLHLYSIMPLNMNHVDEICEDIVKQQERGVASCALFSMTLVPEENPPADKADILCGKYEIFRDKLNKRGIKNGVLMQATIGHGWVLGEMFPYQRYVGIMDGEPVNSVCPYDEGFREYIYKAAARIAKCQPDHVMLDDDLRLMYRSGRGCVCPLHMKRFNELAGTNLTREQLWEHIQSKTELGNQYRDIFVETQKEAVVGAAQAIRDGIDSVDSTIPGSFCAVGNNMEFGIEIAEVMAGKGNPVIVRANNGAYTPVGAKNLSLAFNRIASQLEKLRGKADIVLAETDTCPQNRYSTSAMSLHAHFTGSILEGANGAKHWITRLADYEPESGKAYRKLLSKYRGFYESLAQLVPSLKWRGLRIPVSGKPYYNVGDSGNWVGDSFGHWCTCVFERLGLPVYFSSKQGGIACLDEIADTYFNDAELMEAFKGNMILSVESAEALIKRGFQEYIGVDVQPWTGKTPTHEFVHVNGKKMNVQMQTKRLIPLSNEVREDSVVCHSVDKEHFERLFPGSVVYKNKLGGTVVTFCGVPRANYILTEAFSFLNYSRKQQFIRLLQGMGESLVYYTDDQEVYLKAADMPDGKLFCALFNISLDPMEEIPLHIEGKVTKIEKLLANGEREEVAFKIEDGKYTVQTACNTLNPVILFITK